MPYPRVIPHSDGAGVEELPHADRVRVQPQHRVEPAGRVRARLGTADERGEAHLRVLYSFF